MGEGKTRVVPSWVAPALSVVLALAAFWLAWRYGWPWGAFLLAEGLALVALAGALWRTDEGYPWWAFPALFVGLVILFFSWLYLGKGLKLAEAIQAGSAVVLAFFTITLWRSTHAQAEATRSMRDLQEALVRSELVPCLAFAIRSKQLVLARENPKNEHRNQPLLEVCNLSRWGVVVEDVSAKAEELWVERVERDEAVAYAPWKPIGRPPFSLGSGECAALWLRGVTNGSHEYELRFSFIYSPMADKKREVKLLLKAVKGTGDFTLEIKEPKIACE